MSESEEISNLIWGRIWECFKGLIFVPNLWFWSKQGRSLRIIGITRNIQSNNPSVYSIYKCFFTIPVRMLGTSCHCMFSIGHMGTSINECLSPCRMLGSCLRSEWWEDLQPTITCHQRTAGRCTTLLLTGMKHKHQQTHCCSAWWCWNSVRVGGAERNSGQWHHVKWCMMSVFILMAINILQHITIFN